MKELVSILVVCSLFLCAVAEWDPKSTCYMKDKYSQPNSLQIKGQMCSIDIENAQNEHVDVSFANRTGAEGTVFVFDGETCLASKYVALSPSTKLVYRSWSTRVSVFTSFPNYANSESLFSLTYAHGGTVGTYGFVDRKCGDKITVSDGYLSRDGVHDLCVWEMKPKGNAISWYLETFESGNNGTQELWIFDKDKCDETPRIYVSNNNSKLQKRFTITYNEAAVVMYRSTDSKSRLQLRFNTIYENSFKHFAKVSFNQQSSMQVKGQMSSLKIASEIDQHVDVGFGSRMKEAEGTVFVFDGENCLASKYAALAPSDPKVYRSQSTRVSIFNSFPKYPETDQLFSVTYKQGGTSDTFGFVERKCGDPITVPKGVISRIGPQDLCIWQFKVDGIAINWNIETLESSDEGAQELWIFDRNDCHGTPSVYVNKENAKKQGAAITHGNVATVMYRATNANSKLSFTFTTLHENPDKCMKLNTQAEWNNIQSRGQMRCFVIESPQKQHVDVSFDKRVKDVDGTVFLFDGDNCIQSRYAAVSPSSTHVYRSWNTRMAVFSSFPNYQEDENLFQITYKDADQEQHYGYKDRTCGDKLTNSTGVISRSGVQDFCAWEFQLDGKAISWNFETFKSEAKGKQELWIFDNYGCAGKPRVYVNSENVEEKRTAVTNGKVATVLYRTTDATSSLKFTFTAV